jgi:ABC-type ATPase with predicted acetyltransferase domain
MGYVKEPDGVDFVINGKPLTEEEERLISEFIKADKMKKRRQILPRARFAGMVGMTRTTELIKN